MKLKEDKKGTLIFGLGNPILSDDGVGVKVAQQLKEHLNSSKNIDVRWGSLSGLRILDEVAGYDKVIIIDAAKMGAKVGKVYRLHLDEFNNAIHLTSPHTINIPTSIYIGKRLGFKMPQEIVIYGIEVKEIKKFSDTLSNEIGIRLNDIVKTIIKKENMRIYDSNNRKRSKF